MKASQPLFLLLIAYLGFISLGLPDTLIGVAWPSVRSFFTVPQSAIALIFFGAGVSYFVSSFFAGRFVQKMGIGLLLAGSSLLVALSMLGYSSAPLWGLFAACSLLHGLGSGAIDSGLNFYASRHFSARHMSWLHACWGLGATLGPLIMTGAMSFASWRAGYLLIAGTLGLMALLFASTRRSWDTPGSVSPTAEDIQTKDTPEAPVSTFAALRHPIVRLQVLLFFLYTGIETTVGQWSFSLLTTSRGIPEARAGLLVTLFWASLAIGRIVFGAFADQIGLDRLLRLSSLTALAGIMLLAVPGPGWLSAFALMLTGAALASIYPTLMSRTPQRLGSSLAAHAIGFQVSAATLGASGLPSLAGLVSEQLGPESLAWSACLLAGLWLLLHESLLKQSAR